MILPNRPNAVASCSAETGPFGPTVSPSTIRVRVGGPIGETGEELVPPPKLPPEWAATEESGGSGRSCWPSGTAEEAEGGDLVKGGRVGRIRGFGKLRPAVSGSKRNAS